VGQVQVLCLGESMALFMPDEEQSPDRSRTWIRTVGGAESNVACHLAGIGVRAGWVSAVGDDALGRAVLSAVAAAGVDVSGVVVDQVRPTGLYLKESGLVRYYRAGSAASGMGPELLVGLPLDGVRIVHTSGITPALSDSCLALTRALFALPRHGFRVSFDLNWRPALWRGRDRSVLRELADRADIVLVGEDEAAAAWGVSEPERIRALLPGPDTLVVKHGERGATLIERDLSAVFEPALRLAVVDPMGAGDAFAAGFLAAPLAGAPASRRLRAGHLQAAAALRTREDVGPPLPPEVVADLLEADEATWAAWRMAP
jgi:2-dehydro-3-deoxygluconokinase